MTYLRLGSDHLFSPNMKTEGVIDRNPKNPSFLYDLVYGLKWSVIKVIKNI